MKKREPLLDLIRPAMQGVCGWIIYRRTFYNRYPITEGAFIVELCNILQAHLTDNQILECEVPYTAINKGIKKGGQGKDCRADIVIRKKGNKNSIIAKYECAIEVKRLCAGKKNIRDDLKKLKQIEDSSIRKFLLLISEKKRPIDFVNDKGTAVKSPSYKVRRVCKSTTTFKNVNTANYAVLIEVV